MVQIKQCPPPAHQVQLLPVERIWPSPTQPRRRFEGEALRELTLSISRYGVLSPLCVRPAGAGCYELIAGERRLRAARLAGLRQVPCTVLQADDLTAETLALVENLQREDLDYLEEAEGLQRLLEHSRFTQEEVARMIGKSPAAVSNKLRLLRHPLALRALLRQYGLGERHARALLRLEDLGDRAAAARYIGENGLSAERAEEYIESLVVPRPKPKRRKLGDPSLFFSTLEKALATMRRAGVPADMETREEPGEIRVMIRIPRG